MSEEAQQQPFQPELVGQELAVRSKAELERSIQERTPNPGEIFYGHTILTSTLFPTTQPPEGTDFVSKDNGGIEYLLEAGVDSVTRARGFPYGKYPRLIMAWIAKQIRAAGGRKTDTVDPETRMITIPTIYQFCEELGLKRGGRTSEQLQQQLRRLLAARISVRRTAGFAGTRALHDTVYLPIIEAVREASDDEDAGRSGFSFFLTKEVYDRLSRESAPFDTRASTYLLGGRSVLPYDVYVWLTGTMSTLKHDLPVSWKWLYERFGDGISVEQNFRTKFKEALKKIKRVYPQVNVTVERSKGIVVHPSPTSVPMRRKRDLPGKAEE